MSRPTDEIPLPSAYQRRIGRLFHDGTEQALQDRAAAEGKLEEIVEIDRAGRPISRFRGRSFIDDFRGPVRRVIGFNIPEPRR